MILLSHKRIPCSAGMPEPNSGEKSQRAHDARPPPVSPRACRPARAPRENPAFLPSFPPSPSPRCRPGKCRKKRNSRRVSEHSSPSLILGARDNSGHFAQFAATAYSSRAGGRGGGGCKEGNTVKGAGAILIAKMIAETGHRGHVQAEEAKPRSADRKVGGKEEGGGERDKERARLPRFISRSVLRAARITAEIPFEGGSF